MNRSLIKWHIVIAILLVWIGLLTGITASAQGGGVPIIVTGDLTVLITDNFTQGTATTSYFIAVDNSGPTYELQFGGSPPANLSTDQRATIEGHLDGNTLWVDTLTVLPDGITVPPPYEWRSVLVLLVDLQDAKASDSYTRNQIEGFMYTDPRSVAELYRQASFGWVDFSNGSNFVAVTIPYSAAQDCNYTAWAQAADTAAAQAGISRFAYRHRLFVLPPQLPHCGWTGAAELGCAGRCRAWIAAGDQPMVYVHELGHHLNLNHAGTDPDNNGVIDSFNDPSDPMSLSLPSGWRSFNAPHLNETFWYSYAHYDDNIVLATQGGTYTIAALDPNGMTNSPGLPRIIELAKEGTDNYYYLSYRQPNGYDADLPSTYTQGLNIHWHQNGNSTTALVSTLTDGNTANLTDTSGSLIWVTQNSHNSNDVTFDIHFCNSTPAHVDLVPSNPAVRPGGTSIYSVSVSNWDGPDCPATQTTFALTYSGAPGGTITPSSLSLNSRGGSGSANLQVNAPAGLASGIYPIEVQVSDADNIPPDHPVSSKVSGVFIVDGDPPTVPTGLSGFADTRNRTIALQWNASSDTLTNVQNYIVRRNNSTIGFPAGLSFVDSNAPLGQNVYTVAAIDAVGNESAPSAPITLAWNTAPVVTITVPADGATFTTDQAITFTGTATDTQDGNLTAGLSWTSDGGNIGSGGSFSLKLPAGTHTIQARVSDSNGATGTATLTINVINPTTSTFTSIGAEDGWVLESSETSNVGGSLKASDSTGSGLLLGDSSKKYQYKSILSFDTSSLPNNALITSATLRLQRGTLSGTNPFTTHGALLADIATGAFNNNAALETADFQAPATTTGVATLSNAASNGAWSEGTLNANGLAALNKTGKTQFRLYFSLDDNNNGTADTLGYYAGEYTTAASRPQLVVNYVVNTAPTVTITAPVTNTQVAPGTPIPFSGSAGDAEDGNLSARLVWTSSRDGVIGRGGSFTTSTLSVGIHTITATVTDGFGAQAMASLTLINSNNHFPTVTINTPTDNARVPAGQMITFSGSAGDLEDGNLTAGLQWTSSIDGPLGSGGTFSRPLSVGTHTIQARATDSAGFSGTATVTLTVANPTTVTLTSIGGEDGWVLESSESSTVGGSLKASDSTTKGVLLGDTTSNQQYRSILSFDTSTLPAGATITAANLRLQRGTLSGTSPFSTHGTLLADVVTGAFNGNNALETADFQAPASATGVATLSVAASNGAWSEGSLNAQGLAALNRTGRTQFRLYFSLDDDNDKVADYLGYYAGEYSTAASRPQLVVTYY